MNFDTDKFMAVIVTLVAIPMITIMWMSLAKELYLTWKEWKK